MSDGFFCVLHELTDLKTYYVYILQRKSCKGTYIGQTGDLKRRIDQHNDPAHNSKKFTTKRNGPWILIHHEEFPTRSDAMKREKWLKTGAGRDWIKTNVLVEQSAAAD